MTRWRSFIAVVAVLCLAACAGLPEAERASLVDAALPQRVELGEVPFHPQDRYQCGPAALATVLGQAGVARSPKELREQVYLPGREGSLQPEMQAATRRAGLLAYPLEPELPAVLREVAAGNPVLVLQNLRFAFLPQWHYAVVVGYDLGEQRVVLRSGTDKRRLMPLGDFERSWQRAGRWAFVALGPDRLPATAREGDYVAAAIALERMAPAAARSAYRTALTAWPRNLVAQLGLGNAAYRLKDLGGARTAYQQAVTTHPDSADAWNNLAQASHELGRRREAVEAARRAVAIGGPRLRVYEATLAGIEEARR